MYLKKFLKVRVISFHEGYLTPVRCTQGFTVIVFLLSMSLRGVRQEERDVLVSGVGSLCNENSNILFFFCGATKFSLKGTDSYHRVRIHRGS